MMTLQQFKALLDAYGPMVECWPTLQRAEAEALVAHSPEACRLVEQARRFETMLNAALAPEAGTEPLRERILRRVAAEASRPSWLARQLAATRLVWTVGVAAAAAAALAGFLVGWTQAGPLPSDDGPDIAGLVWGTASVEGEEG